MSERLILGVIALILLRGSWQRIDVYSAFLHGAQEGLHTAVNILPALCAMLLMLNITQASGLMTLLSRLLAPLLHRLNLPAEITPVLLLRPLSGSGSLAALEQLYQQYGVDSRISRLASVLMGSSETVFYTLTVYLAAADLRRLPRVISVSLLSGLIGAVAAGLIVR